MLYCPVVGSTVGGDNFDGELGNGTTIDSDVPVPVSGITDATAISTGELDVCALLSGGSIDCWGDNDYGGLGNGTDGGPESCLSYNYCSTKPVPVSGITDATAISVGNFGNACALLPTGGVDCWGDDAWGQLGDSTDTDLDECENGDHPCSPNPVQIDGITDAIEVTVGGASICTRSPTGGVDCWGNNEYGQLGDGTTENSDVPVQVSGIE